jgi:hypothetical protein
VTFDRRSPRPDIDDVGAGDRDAMEASIAGPADRVVAQLRSPAAAP